MSKSYIPRNTFAVCTNMTVAKPLKLEHTHRSTVVHKSAGNPMLNKEDKKINDTFVCKNPRKFWGGLGALLVGIAVGVLIGAAVVASGGTALFVIAGACALAGGGCIIGGELKAHDCDVSQSGTWKLTHTTVFINKKNALLQTSILPCSQGGMISIVPNSVLAQHYANIYAENNEKEVNMHQAAQFFEGVVSGFVALGSPFAAIAGVGLGTYFYAKGENDSQAAQYNALMAEADNDAGTGIERNFGDDLSSTVQNEKTNQAAADGISTAEVGHEGVKNQVAINQKLNKQILDLERQAAEQEARAAKLAANGATEQADIVAARAANTRLAADIAKRSYRMPWNPSAWKGLKVEPTKMMGKPVFPQKVSRFGTSPAAKLGVSIGVGLGGAIVNFAIEYGSNKYEDGKFNNVAFAFEQLIKTNKGEQQGVNILSTNG